MAGKNSEKLLEKILDAIELEITTCVTPEIPLHASAKQCSSEQDELEKMLDAIDQYESEPDDSQRATSRARMHTKIHLIDGDISNEISSQFLSNGSYFEQGKLHLKQVKKGCETAQENIRKLQEWSQAVLTISRAKSKGTKS